MEHGTPVKMTDGVFGTMPCARLAAVCVLGAVGLLILLMTASYTLERQSCAARPTQQSPCSQVERAQALVAEAGAAANAQERITKAHRAQALLEESTRLLSQRELPTTICSASGTVSNTILMGEARALMATAPPALA